MMDITWYRSFGVRNTEPLMTTEDIKEQPFWKDEVWGYDLRIKELPKNASLKSGIKVALIKTLYTRHNERNC